MMIDHFSIRVKNLEKSKEFYKQLLEPLGYTIAFDIPQAVSFAEERTSSSGDFWIQEGIAEATHFAFNAATRKQVDAFYTVGLAIGGKDNGAPGIREKYKQPYYAAFILDCDGNNVEAVCHEEE